MYCSLRFSVSSSFIVISACSSLSTGFLKSKSGSRIENGCDALSLIAIFCNMECFICICNMEWKVYICNMECLFKWFT